MIRAAKRERIIVIIEEIKWMCRKAEALTSSIEGSGMNKPTVWFLGYSNGGTYALEICNISNNTCCRHSQHTPCYNTIIFAKITSISLLSTVLN
jgi:hypothetical protein